MAASSQLMTIVYDGMDKGPIYLEDVGQRPQMGKGEQGVPGQDLYMHHGDRVSLKLTDRVQKSCTSGVIKMNTGSLSFSHPYGSPVDIRKALIGGK